MGFGSDDKQLIMSKNAPSFLLPFYKNLFAASILQKPNQNECNKLFNAQNFPRNLLFSCGDDKEVNLLLLLSSPNLFIYPCCIAYWNLCFIIFRKSHRDFLGLRQTTVKQEITTRTKQKNWIPSWNLHQPTRLLISSRTAILRCHQ